MKMAKKGCTPATVFRVFDSILLLIIVGIQGSALNFLMIHYGEGNEKLYYWFIGDGVVLLFFIVTLIISYRFILVRVYAKLENIDIPHIEVPMYGTLPFGYISWLVYGSLVVAKIVFIFQSKIPSELPAEPSELYSTTSLKIVLSLSTVIFILLINTEHDADPNTDRNNYIADLCKGIAFDLFDSIFFLGILLVKESELDKFPEYYEDRKLRDAVIALSCINFLLPALSLMKLSLSDFGEQSQPIRLSLLVKTLKLFAINIPYMVIRIYLFYTDTTIALFLVKNVLYVAVCLRYLIPEYVDACRGHKKAVSTVKPITVVSS